MLNLKISAAKKNLKEFANLTFLKYFYFELLFSFQKLINIWIPFQPVHLPFWWVRQKDAKDIWSRAAIIGSSTELEGIITGRLTLGRQMDPQHGSEWEEIRFFFVFFFHLDALHKKCTHCVISSAKCKMIVIIQLEAKNWKHLWKWCNANMPWPEAAIIHRIELFMWRKVSDLWRDFTVNS